MVEAEVVVVAPPLLPEKPVLDVVRDTVRAHDGMPQQVDDDDYCQDETVVEEEVQPPVVVAVGSVPSPQPTMGWNDDGAEALVETP